MSSESRNPDWHTEGWTGGNAGRETCSKTNTDRGYVWVCTLNRGHRGKFHEDHSHQGLVYMWGVTLGSASGSPSPEPTPCAATESSSSIPTPSSASSGTRERRNDSQTACLPDGERDALRRLATEAQATRVRYLAALDDQSGNDAYRDYEDAAHAFVKSATPDRILALLDTAAEVERLRAERDAVERLGYEWAAKHGALRADYIILRQDAAAVVASKGSGPHYLSVSPSALYALSDTLDQQAARTPPEGER